ncbi:class I SAM-dependent methyltransferase [Verticiella sediminum]|uniref:Class I SAM-dependent methyltransferase n=1 Tax=Verticiella sediminum TaxID=1247510 RepID=A0A556AYN8_9BURK|nr:class I SAM-dependent methyltransferase [Verticiella sediminum]TSH98059.1 class I SAM-dependent methyltransferase [Verticiella sediminum]
MAQNIYDTPEFFAGYSGLPRSVLGLDGAPEWPSVRALLPALAGRDVVDLGCGFGAFARWAAQQDAASVLALDLSENMLARARELTASPAVRYQRADLEQLSLPRAAFDLAYSALALHYVEDYARLAASVFDALRPGSAFVFTIEHPIYMASTRPGWLQREDGERTWALDHYACEGERITHWFADGVRKYHRTLATTVNTLLAAGFTLERIAEWSPSADQLAQQPALGDEMQRPMLLVVAASR